MSAVTAPFTVDEMTEFYGGQFPRGTFGSLTAYIRKMRLLDLASKDGHRIRLMPSEQFRKEYAADAEALEHRVNAYVRRLHHKTQLVRLQAAKEASIMMEKNTMGLHHTHLRIITDIHTRISSVDVKDVGKRVGLPAAIVFGTVTRLANAGLMVKTADGRWKKTSAWSMERVANTLRRTTAPSAPTSQVESTQRAAKRTSMGQAIDQFIEVMKEMRDQIEANEQKAEKYDRMLEAGR